MTEKSLQTETDIFRSINDFAKIVGVPSVTIRRMVKEGKLPTLPRGQKHVLIPVKAASQRLVELSIAAMQEQNDFISTIAPIENLVQMPAPKQPKRRGRLPDSIRLGRAAK